MEDNRNAYSEVLEILKIVDDEEKLEKLPMEMLEVIKSKANPEYKPQISKEIPLEEQNLQKETLSILSWIATKYWSDEIENTLESNEIENDTIQNNVETIEEQNNNEICEENIQEEIEQPENNLPILHSDLKWYQKIKVRIIEFINKIFRKSKLEEKNEMQ